MDGGNIQNMVSCGCYQAHVSPRLLLLSGKLKEDTSLFSLSASRNVSDWWLAYWISHSHVSNSTAHQHVNLTRSSEWYQVIAPVLNADQLGMHVHIVKDTVTFYLVVYGGLAVSNTVSALTY